MSSRNFDVVDLGSAVLRLWGPVGGARRGISVGRTDFVDEALCDRHALRNGDILLKIVGGMSAVFVNLGAALSKSTRVVVARCNPHYAGDIVRSRSRWVLNYRG